MGKINYSEVRRQLFDDWMRLKQNIQSLATVTQNPMTTLTPMDLVAWKKQIVQYEEAYKLVKTETEELIKLYVQY